MPALVFVLSVFIFVHQWLISFFSVLKTENFSH
jgi:hypothetical protein